MFVFVCASLLYGVANAQTYEGFIGAEDWKTVGTPQDSEEGYAPDFSYQISVVDEGKLQVTVDMSATCVGLVPQLFVNDRYLMNLNPVDGSASQFSKALSSMMRMLSGKMTSTADVHPLKAS